jgi:hypothetical protein
MLVAGQGVEEMMNCLFYIPIFVLYASTTAAAQTMGLSPSNPALKNTTIAGIVECGEGYTSHELYDVKITLVDVIRGEKAWKRIQGADPKNSPVPPGTEYLLARINFKYFARGLPGNCVHHLIPEQFTAYSTAGDDYKTLSSVLLKPELRKDLKAGESFDGWIVFAVSQEDKAPLMSYSVDNGGAVQHGENKWFLLR